MNDDIIRDTVIAYIDPTEIWPEPEDTKYWNGSEFVYGLENAQTYSTAEAFPVLNEVRGDGVILAPAKK